MAKGSLLNVLVILFCFRSPAQTLSDAEIRAAIERGRSTSRSVLWHELTKGEARITRGEFGAPVELWVSILTDADRITVEAAHAQHQLRDFSVDEAKSSLGNTDVLLEAKCLCGHAGALYRWTNGGGVHMVLKIGNRVVQPLQKEDEVSPRTSWRWCSTMTWFTFPEVPEDIQRLTVTVIPASGKPKEKEVVVR